jgi:FtsP/CotA-like multicopper oxidase with cupredoxin domain
MAQSNCPPRPAAGSVVANPFSLQSANNGLTVSLTLQNSIDSYGYLHDCLNYQGPNGTVEAPTWHLNPGDELIFNLRDQLVANPLQQLYARRMRGMAPMTMMEGACQGGTVTGLTTNMHFHGLNIPPTCHQDDVLTTLIQPFTPPFTYRTQIPQNEPPGLYWYHPHPHGFTTIQVNGGAAGALIVDGIEKVKPQVAGLPTRVFVIRQQFLNPNSWLPGTNELTINFVPIVQFGAAPVIQMKPGAKEFWRVANASTQAFLTLQILNGGTPQNLEVIAYDGVPVQTDTTVTSILLAPAARAEFIMQGPAAGGAEVFQTAGFDTGPVGNPNPQLVFANIVPTADAVEPEAMPRAPTASQSAPAQRFGGLLTQAPTAKRKLYFAEATQGSNGPTEYVITVDGQQPKVFNVNDPPAIVTQVGAVEDWTIENHAGETHAFHIHQIHFLVLEMNGQPVSDPELHDTITVPYWKGTGSFPSVKVRMDFRDPEIAGTFVYHCHILDHEDGGMMAKIRVDPAK